jgi:hypothetical protein
MAKLFMCNTSNIHEMKFGRPQSVILADAMPNGVIVELGKVQDDKEGDHLHSATAAAGASVIGKFIVVAPEINAQQYRTIDGQIGKFVLEAGEAYSAYMLQKHDRIEYSDAYFAELPAKGDKVNPKAKDGNGAVFAKGGAALEVVSVRELWLPIVLQANVADAQGNGKAAKLMPESCKMIKLEVIA